MLADWIHIDQMHADADVCPGSTYTGRRIYMQEGEARREQLLQMLRDSTAPISGSALARSLCVSRQVIVQHDFGSGFNCVIMGAACDDIQRFGIGMLQTVTEFCHIPTVLQNEIGCDLPVNLMFNDDIKHLAAVVNNGIQFICNGIIAVVDTVNPVTGFRLLTVQNISLRCGENILIHCTQQRNILNNNLTVVSERPSSGRSVSVGYGTWG